MPCLNSTASGSSRCSHDPHGFPPRRQTAAQRRAHGHNALIDLLAGFDLFCFINILLPQVAEKIESFADEDYLAMSFIRIAAAEVLEGGTLPQDFPRFGCCAHQIWCARPFPTRCLNRPLQHRCAKALRSLICASKARLTRNASAAASGSKEELHPNFNTILINGIGGIWRLAVIAGQIEIAPGEIQLGGIADGIAHANLGIA